MGHMEILGEIMTKNPSAITNGMIWNISYQIVSEATDRYPLALSPPAAPTLQSITPNPSPSDSVLLNWTEVSGASYRVYRNTSTITSTAGLNPIQAHTQTGFFDTGLTNGTYYYVITAINNTGVSGISNCVSVVVSIAPSNINTTTTTTTNSTTSTGTTTKANEPGDNSVNGFSVALMLITTSIVAVILLHKKKKIIRNL
jgi:fibronectin type 3 domain-containing protein